MKKKLLVLLPLLFLVGCAQPELAKDAIEESYNITYNVNMLPTVHRDNSKHITYLMLSRYGKLKLGSELLEGGDIPEKYYENCVALESQPGLALPEAVSTYSEEIVFRGWYQYNDKVFANKIENVPAESGQTLYAIFDGPKGGSGGGGGGGGGGGETETAFGFKFFGTNTRTVKGVYTGKEYDGDGTEYDQYKVTACEFKKDDVFALYDFKNDNSWVVSLNPYSFGDNEGTGLVWPTWLSKGDSTYTALKDFTADVYIKLCFGKDNVYFERV